MSMPENYSIFLSANSIQYPLLAEWMSQTAPWLRMGMDSSQCLKSFEGQGKEIYLLKVKNELAGFVILQTVGSFRGYIQTLLVHPDYQGKGYGRILLQYCEKRARQFSPNLFICVSEFNEGAQRLYENFGFQKIGAMDDFVKKGFTELLYRKSWSPMIDFKPS